MAITNTARRQTLADVLLPVRQGAAGLTRDATLVLGGAALTALAAQLRFVMPWTEVPYTGQTGAVLLVGTALGWRRGLLSMLLYVLAGVAGVPVFNGGASGAQQLLGVTGGYLVGFVVAAALVGWLAERGWDRSVRRAAGLMLLGNLAIYAIGVPVLAAVAELPPADAAWRGAGVFLPWDAVKVVVAAGLLPTAWRLAGHRS
ncbi:MAG TPA: biotin transporter BioY [candidate division Zixibacteria bacterium]|nr:biotin transporter BioY [candidate division Zixibacteria bacterium]